MELTAYDGNQWRVDRLKKVARIACSILGLSHVQMEALIAELRDHKGELVITWRHAWTPNQVIAFDHAWRECGEYNVHHTKDGEIAA